jgi:hypothetical protein
MIVGRIVPISAQIEIVKYSLMHLTVPEEGSGYDSVCIRALTLVEKSTQDRCDRIRDPDFKMLV